MLKRSTLACAVAVVALCCGSVFLATQHMSHSVWFDESQTHRIAHQDTIAGIAKLARTERSYPPLFFLAVHQALRLRDDEAGLRLPAALFGALAAFAVFLLGREVADGLAGLTAASLFVLTPGAFRYFVDGNAYTLLMLASALSTLCLLRAARSDGLKDWLLYGLLALAGLGTHVMFMFHLGAHLVAGLYLRASVAPAPGARYRRLLTVMSLLIAVAMVWSFIYVRGGGDVRPLEFSRMAHPRMLVTLAGMYVGPLVMGGLVPLVLWCSLQLLGAAGLFQRCKRTLWALVILAGLPLVAITLFIVATLEYVAYRYALGVFPLACVVAACSWEALPQRRIVARACLCAAMLGYCASGAVFIARAGQNTFGYQDWRSAGQYLSRFSEPGETVLVSPRAGLLPLTYYYKAPGVVASAMGEAPDFVVRHLQATDKPNRGVWVVFSTFANDNPLVARYTEFRGMGPDQQIRALVAAIESRSFFVCQTARFQRVTVFVVRRRPCPV